MATISVCMAARNGERYIGRQIGTILRQVGPEDELIISDDSSTDRTVEIIKGFGDSRIRLLEGNAFHSPIFNIENALKRASGDIIVLSDQDDIWLDNKITAVRREFAERHAGIRLIVLDGAIVDERETVLHESIFARINSGAGLLKNIFDNTYMGCCMAFSRDLLTVALPFPKQIPMHDMWLGLLAELFGTVSFVTEKTILYRRHEGSATSLDFQWRVTRQLRRRYHLVASLLGRYLRVKRGKPRVNAPAP